MNADRRQERYASESKNIRIGKGNHIDQKIAEALISTDENAEQLQQGKSEQIEENKQHKALHKAFCSICNKYFRDKYKLRRHENIHKRNTEHIEDTSKYVCDHCSMLFVCKDEVKEHIRAHFTYKPYVCQVCKKCFLRHQKLRMHKRCHLGPEGNGFFVSEKEMQLHIANVNNLTIRRCIPCSKVFTITEYKQHKALHKAQQNTCSICNKNFRDKYKLRRHENVHERKPIEEYKQHKALPKAFCSICNKYFRDKYKLRRHENIHKQNTEHIKDTSKYVCDHCSMLFVCKDEVKEHIRAHFTYKPYVCQVCKKCFSSHQKLRMHKRCHLCPECNGCFVSEKELQLHIVSVHLKIRRCLPCDKVFTITEYKQHKALHKAQQNTCSVCNKYFQDKYKLHKHEKVHKRDFRFSCKICKKPFRCIMQLNTHMFNWHTPHGKKTEQNKCYECGKLFEKYMGLYNHLSIHYEKQYICDKCGKKFTRKHQLTNHMTSHSEIRNHVCDTCGAQFKMPHHLRNHKKKPYIITISG